MMYHIELSLAALKTQPCHHVSSHHVTRMQHMQHLVHSLVSKFDFSHVEIYGKIYINEIFLQLVRTTADIFRLVPLLVIIIVPFAEFSLPFILIFFPKILPSTFQDPKDEVSCEQCCNQSG